MLLSIRDGSRAVSLESAAVLAIVSRRRGWRSSLAVANLVAEVLFPATVYAGPRKSTTVPMRALTPLEGVLVTLRAFETSRITSVPAGSYWDNEEGEVHFGGRETGEPNRQVFQDAESFL